MPLVGTPECPWSSWSACAKRQDLRILCDGSASPPRSCKAANICVLTRAYGIVVNCVCRSKIALSLCLTSQTLPSPPRVPRAHNVCCDRALTPLTLAWRGWLSRPAARCGSVPPTVTWASGLHRGLTPWQQLWPRSRRTLAWQLWLKACPPAPRAAGPQ